MVSTMPAAASYYLAKPKGPSWSPYLAMGMVILFGAIIVFLLMRSRRR
ncbi:hypothetical protein [Streptomyces similanensis]